MKIIEFLKLSDWGNLLGILSIAIGVISLWLSVRTLRTAKKIDEQIKKERADAVVQKIRAEFLEDGELTDETTVLSMLLKHSGELKRYFSKYEEKELKERLKQLKENEMASIVHTALEEIEGMVVAIIAASGSAGS